MDKYITTLGYKDTFMPYYGKGGSLYPGHHGEDLVPEDASAVNFPVKIAGTILGLMGDTGAAVGAHVHIDKSIDGTARYSSYRSPSDWQTVTGVVTFAGNLGTAGNTVIIKADNGHIYRFLHFNKVTVRVGQRIGEKDVLFRDLGNQIRGYISEVAGRDYKASHDGLHDKPFLDTYGHETPEGAFYKIFTTKEAGKFRTLRGQALEYYESKASNDAAVKQRDDLVKKVKALEGKEPEVVVKEVEKIVEVVKEVEVIKEVQRDYTLRGLIEWIKSVIKGDK